MGVHSTTVLTLTWDEILPVTVRLLISLLSMTLFIEKALRCKNMGEGLCDPIKIHRGVRF